MSRIPLEPARLRRQYEELLRPELDALYRTARRMTGNADSASDLVQDACLKAYERFDSFEVGTNFRAWIFRILKNTILDSMRRTKRAPFVPLSVDDFSDLIESNAGPRGRRNQPELELVRKAFIKDAAAAFSKLPEDIRMVVSLALLEDMPYAEIGVIMDCPVGTVRSRLNRGRQRLREMLAEYVSDRGTGGARVVDLTRYGNGPIH